MREDTEINMSSYPEYPGSTLFYGKKRDDATLVRGSPILVHQLVRDEGIVSIDQWFSPNFFSTALGEFAFHEFILDAILKPILGQNTCLAWVADFFACDNFCTYSRTTIEKIHTLVFPSFAEKGVKDFIIVDPEHSSPYILSGLRQQIHGFRAHLLTAGIRPHYARTPDRAYRIILDIVQRKTHT